MELGGIEISRRPHGLAPPADSRGRVGGNWPVDIKLGDWGTPVISVVVACAISWSLIALAKLITSAFVLKAATAFALVGFTVVLVHPAVLWLLEPRGVPSVLVLAAAVAAPAAIGFVGRRTRLSQWVTGVKRAS